MVWIRKRRFIRRISLWALKATLFVLLFMFVVIPVVFKYTYPLQRSVIFLNFVNYPWNTDLKNPSKYGLTGARNFYITTKDSIDIGVWHILPAALGNSSSANNDSFYEKALLMSDRPIMLYLHGNSGCRASGHRVELYLLLSNLGYHVIAIDYRSYGDSTNVPPSEMGVVNDALTVYRWILQKTNGAPVFVWGHSLGTGVASHMLDVLSKEGIQTKGLVLEAPFTNLRDELRLHPFADMSLSKSRLTEFNDDWLTDQRFQPWLQKVKNDKHAFFCSMCRSTLNLSNMGKRAVTSHLNGQKHQSRSRVKSECDLRFFLKTSDSSAGTCSQQVAGVGKSEESLEENKCAKNVVESETLSSLGVENSSKLCRPITSRPLHSLMLKDENTKADILWCLLVIINHWSVNSAGKAVNVFKTMFSDSSIAMNMRLQRTKISYTIVYGLAPYFHKELLQDISHCNFFVIAFDESLNKISQKEQMDIVIRFWCKSNTVSTRYFTSAFLGHTTAADLVQSFKEAISELDLRKLMQISMDGPNVNLKFLADLKADLNRDPSDHVILEIGSCGLHTLHNAFKVGINSTGWKIFSFLHAVYNFFKDRPARRSDYTVFSGSAKFPVKFCNVRWLQNFEVAQRALEIIPNLKKYIEGVKENKKEPAMSGSYASMVEGVRDKLMPAKLAFFCFLVKEIEDFLELFQTDAPMAPFLHTELTSILTSLMEHFVKPEAMNSKNIISIDLSKTDILLHAKKVDVGYGTRDALRRIDSLKEIDILSFKLDCRTILQTTCKKIMVKSPLKFKLAKGITCCDPQLIVKSPQVAEQRLQISLEVFVENNWLSGSEAQKIHTNYKELCENQEILVELKNFRRKESRLDEFWATFFLKHNSSEELVKFIKMVLVFSHGNASVERGFSVNKDCLVENMQERSLIGQRQVWDGVQAFGGVVQDLNINKAMILSARNAHSRYQDAQADRKKRNENEEKENNEKKRAAEIKMDLEMQKKKKIEELTLLDEQIRVLEKNHLSTIPS